MTGNLKEGMVGAWRRTARAFAEAVESGRLGIPLPGSGSTRERWAAFADRTVYLRLHHAERDLARLGELLAERGAAW
jgi:hypothetical protein